ncbi:hypothetical protein Vadar_009666 [Vaccinium darrowii]|uniref:Uncharacterized protein n=1 Tax=Vaccinium darrowii TaxID=229202 RepID=A0ACB7WZ64_9ERIC|nr:hypothetical protein Vadar_009666 [Vaccinium darrowii]
MDTIYLKRTLYTDTELDSFEILSLLGQTLDSGIQPRTNQAIREVIRCLLGMNLNLVKDIRECEYTPELRKLAQKFSNDSEKTLEFCCELKNCLEKVEGRYSSIIDALKLVDGSDVNRYAKTMQEFKKIKGAGESDPFLELKNIFQPYLLGKLQTSKKRLDKKLKTIQARRRAASIIFDVTLCAAVICSILAAAIAAPPVAAGLAAAGTIPLRSRIKSLWKKDEDAVKEQKVVVESMDKATRIGIQELDQIEVVIKELEKDIEPLLSIPNVDFAGQEVIVKIEIEKIKKKMGVFVKNVKDLEAQADMCIQNVQLAKTVVLQKLIKTSKSFNP